MVGDPTAPAAGAGPAGTAVKARTACPLDCPDGCSLEVTVVDGRLAGVDHAPVGHEPEGGAVNPLTDGWICRKVRGHAGRVYAPERVLGPLVRTGPKGSGSWREVDWDEALDLVADRMIDARDRFGPEAIVPWRYNSSGGVLAKGSLSAVLFRALGASRVLHTICAATAEAAWELTFGDLPGADLAHLDHLDHGGLVVVWGANPGISNSHALPLVERARRRGAPLVVVDPRRTSTARQADLHLAVRPGTDVVLAMAVATELDRRGWVDEAFVGEHAAGVDEYLAACAGWTVARAAEVCGVERAGVEALARMVHEHRPGFFRLGWGFERNRNGGSAHRAVLALPVLTGQLGVLGSGVLVSSRHELPIDERAVARAVLGEEGMAALPPPGRALNMNHLGRWLTDRALEPPVAVLFVQGANPAVTAPDQVRILEGLARDDVFTVVHDQVMTDTAAMADVVLPATTHFEATDVATPYGAKVAELMPPVIDPLGEARTNDEVVAGLALRLGFEGGGFEGGGFDPDPARRLAVALPDGLPDAQALGAGLVQFRDVFPTTPDRRAHLVAPEIDGVDRLPVYRPLDGDADGVLPPLTLLTPATARTVNSIFGELADGVPPVHLHPDDAAARGIADGDPVRVRGPAGGVPGAPEVVLEVTARVDPDLRPGVVTLPKGVWRRSFPGGLTANAFAPEALSDLADGATFNDARVEVERA
jgi:anaerobic selenocysteine-containing dehydrogenase